MLRDREAELLMQGHQLGLEKLNLALAALTETVIKKTKTDELPQWVTLELAVQLKGGGKLGCYKNDLYIQPCCGTNSKLIAGRKCWNYKDVIEWLNITDSDLKQYAEKWRVKLPEKYVRRSA